MATSEKTQVTLWGWGHGHSLDFALEQTLWNIPDAAHQGFPVSLVEWALTCTEESASSRTQILPAACPNSSVTGSRTNDQVSFLSVLSVQGLETKISLSGETGFPTTFRVMVMAGGGGRVGGLLGKQGWGDTPKVRTCLFFIYFCEVKVRNMQMSSFYTSPAFHHRNFEKHCLGKRQFHLGRGLREMGHLQRLGSPVGPGGPFGSTPARDLQPQVRHVQDQGQAEGPK